MIKTLDLFSGIGGFSYALKDICKTVAYCEINEICRNVLQILQNQHKLDQAHIFSDVKTIKKSELNAMKPQMITAGWPCQDIAICNPNGKGLKGSRSGLFYEILRLIDSCSSINILLLENSLNIVNHGIENIVKELKARNFNLSWGIFEAKMVGALHRRRRWVCLATRNDAQLPNIPAHSLSFNWNKKVIPILPKNALYKSSLLRCEMLGNSVVPQLIRYAWNLLIKNKDKGEIPSIPHLRNNDKKVYLSDGHKEIIKDRWATPTHTRWRQYRTLTDRGAQLLCNQIYYNKDLHLDDTIPINMRDKYDMINPIFVEHLMGFPPNWTRAT
jgi:hypothetical protein